MKIFTLNLPNISFSVKNLNKKLPAAFAVRVLMMVILSLGAEKGWGQTPVPMSSQPGLSYAENFADIANWTNNFASGIGASRWGSYPITSGGSANDGIRTTKSSVTFVTATAGGIQRGTGNLVFLSTGSSSPSEAVAVDILLDFTGVNAGTISFNWATIDNSSGTRPTSLRVYWSTDNTTFTEITAAQIIDVQTVSSGSITAVALPSAFNNSATARLRFYNHAGTVTGAGSRDKISIDDLTVTATAASTPSIAISDGVIAAGNANQGTLNKVLQRFDLAITTANATLNGLTVTSAGTYAAADITNLKVRYSTDNILDGGDATLSTKTTGLAAGTQVFPSFTSQVINNGSTGYIFVTADIEPTATAGNTINIGTTAFLNISFSGTVNKTGTDPVAAGGVQTFVAVTPDVALSSPTPAVPAASIFQNTVNNVIYRFDLAVTTANATLNGVTITTSGTYIAADVTNFKCWYSADNTFNAGSDVLLSTKTSSLDAGAQVFPSFTNQVITSGATGYIFITTDIPCAATNGNTLVVDAIATGDISFVSANKTGTANAGGTQTINSATPVNVTGAAASNLDLSSSVSWTNPTGCFDEVMIVAATSANSGTPSGDGSSYTGNLTYGNGTALGNGFVVYKGSTSPQTVIGLTNGTTYYFKIFTRNDLIWSSGVEVTATPAELVLAGEVLINQMSPDFGNASDEYVELVNTTNKTINLANLKLNYRSSAGGGTNSTTLSGTLLPHSFWLLLESGVTNPVTVGQTVSLSRDGTFNGGFSTSGQIALLRVADDFKIDGVGYGTLSGGTYAEGTAATAPPGDGGLKRVVDGQDSNENSTDFTTVTNANIYLRNSASRLANAGASIASATYTDISVTGNSSIAGNTTVSNRLTLTNGGFSIGTNTLTLNGPVSGSGTLTGSSTSNLTIGGTAGTLNFTTGSRILKDLTLNASATATLGTPLEITAGASPATNGTIIIGSGATLASGGNLTLKSNEFGTARVGNSAGTISGNVIVERFIPQRGASATGGRAYRLLAPTVNTTGTLKANWMEGGLVSSVGGTSNPVSNYGTHITGTGGNANNFDVTASNAPSLYFSSNGTIAGLTYTPVTSTITGTGIATMNALTGYFLYIRGDRSVSLQVPLANNMPTTSTTLRTTGTLVMGPVTAFTNPYTGGGTHNLVTNPYASPIDWSLVQPASSGITDFYTFWNPNFGTRGGFVTVNKTELGATRYIQSGQAFFVESDNIAPTPAVSIQESHKSAGNNNGVFLVEPPPVESFKTELYFTEINGFRRIADRVTAVYDNTCSAAVDSKDAKEISNWDENIAIARDGKRLAIEARPVISKSDDLPIFMNNMKKQAYEFEFTPVVFTNTNLKAELIDNYLGTRTLLSVINPTVVSFTITDNPASKATDRFKVVFGQFGNPTGVDVITIKASQFNGGVQVDWTAKTETDMVRYEVEKSTYGTTFVKVNTTAAIGNSNTPVDYNWFDTNPNMGTNFYRIKGIDKAGNVRYSEMVRVLFGKGEPSVVVYPNPVQGKTFKMDMYNLVKGTYVLNLYSNEGRLVHTQQCQHDGSQATYTINLNGDIPQGSYQLQLMNSNGFKTTQIIIKN